MEKKKDLLVVYCMSVPQSIQFNQKITFNGLSSDLDYMPRNKHFQSANLGLKTTIANCTTLHFLELSFSNTMYQAVLIDTVLSGGFSLASLMFYIYTQVH